MPDPRVITFEKDIEEEVRSKAASLTDIAAASGYITSSPQVQKLPSAFLLPSIILVCVLLGIGGGFYYVQKTRGDTASDMAKTIPAPSQNKTLSQNPSSGVTTSTTTAQIVTKKEGGSEAKETIDKETGPSKRLSKSTISQILPRTSPFIESQITKIETALDSYIITFDSYSETFKKIHDHERELADDLLSLYQTGTSTDILEGTLKPSFTDVRIGTLDARILISSSSPPLYYSFIKPHSFLISKDKKALEELSRSIITP